MAEKTSLPPGSSGLPLLGETLPFLRDIFGFVSARIGDGIFRTHILGQPTAIMAGPEACELWVDESVIQRDGASPKPVIELFGGRSLPMFDGEVHRVRKGLIMQAFTPEALVSYLPGLEATVSQALERWAKAGEIRWVDELKRMAIEGICASLFGLGPGAEMDALLADYQVLLRGFVGLPVNIPGTDYGAAIKARDRILARIEALAVERQKAPRDDGVSRLLAARGPGGEAMSLADLRLELHHMVIAGLIIFAEFATTVEMLDAHPQVRERLVAEIREQAPSGPLDHRTLSKMPYLQRVLMEVKRICPNVPVAFGKAKKAFSYRGYEVPKGWLVFLAVGENNRWKGSFSEPDRFDPDRFAEGREEHKRHPHAFVPQGAGDFTGHKCAGYDLSTVFMQVFTVLLLRGYTYRLLPQDKTVRVDLVPPELKSGLVAVVQKAS